METYPKQSPPGTLRKLAPYVISFMVGVLALAFLVGAHSRENTFVGKPELVSFFHTLGYDYFRENGLSLISALRAAPANYIRKVDIPQVVLDIKFEHWQRILAKRTNALDIGFLVQEEGDFVPATIRYSDDKSSGVAKVKVRLKGDMLDHLEGKKWSFRVKTRNKDHVFGMRRFSLQKPQTRHFQSTPIMLWLTKSLGLISPRYFFVELTINGKHIGMMALEEHPAKELIEASERKESVIIRYSEKHYFSALLHRRRTGRKADALQLNPRHAKLWNVTPIDDYRLAPIDGFQSSRIARSPSLSSNYQVAAGLLRAFGDGRQSASKVFDAELMGRFLAISELFGAWHGVRWKSVRFYFNPQTALLEPIPFDLTASLRWQEIISTKYQFFRALIRDEKINRAFRANLKSLIAGVQSGNLTRSLKAAELHHLRRLQKEFVLLGPFPMRRLVKRAPMLMRNIFEKKIEPPAPRNYNQFVLARDFNDGAKRILDLFNTTFVPVTVKRVYFANCTGPAPNQTEAVAEGILPLALPPGNRIGRPEGVSIELKANLGRNCSVLVDSHLIGEGEIKTVSADPDVFALEDRPIPEGSLNEQLAHRDFIDFDRDKNVLSVAAGDHVVRRDVIVPAGATLVIGAGTTLRFAPGSAIVAHGPVMFSGTARAPIILRPVDDQKGWQGIAVLRAGGRSHLHHTQFLHTTGVAKPGWSLTGGVTFYESDVDIVSTTFTGHRGEDALNIVRSDFVIDDTLFEDTLSDAFDSDFSTGRITKSRFENIGTAGGGDAVDTSGSKVEISDTQFHKISDKAISVGEASSVDVQDITIEDTGTGLASKDRSELKASRIIIRNAAFAALAAYTKKPEYGGATIIADDITNVGNQRNLVQFGSRIVLDGREIEAQDIDIDTLYDTVMKPGAR
ncbi:MAG: CotH kinase family protein [Proteobacteria bacterium]|nr:CotH kinase family protein [Pseudomonadota bacterium]